MNKFLSKFKKVKSHSGFVILFTILISAIILMIGAGIFSIATRETVLSSTAREAQIAFYAADTGVECALFAGSKTSDLGNLQFSCGDAQSAIVIPPDQTGTIGNPYIFYVLVINPSNQQKTCAQVNMFKDDTTSQMRIISQGYNICGNDGHSAKLNPVLVERDLDTIYTFESAPVVPPPVTP